MRASGGQLDAGEGLPAGRGGRPAVPLGLVLPTDPRLPPQSLKDKPAAPKPHL